MYNVLYLMSHYLLPLVFCVNEQCNQKCHMVMRRPSWHQATRNTPVPRVVMHSTAVYRYELSSELVKKVKAIREGFRG